MNILLNGLIFMFLTAGFVLSVSWLWDVGVQEILIFTENFLLEETQKLRVRVLPDVSSRKWWDRLELMLYYSGIRSYFPFCSAKVWLLFCFVVLCSVFLISMLVNGSVLQALIVCTGLGIIMMYVLGIMRRENLRATEKHLLELINVTESFAVTGEEPVAILRSCSIYMKGPVGRALRNIEKYISQGWSSRMILEQLKVQLEHPKWQEFIHNLNVCSMYNSDFAYVFRSSRKSIQAYLTARKEQESVKHTAQAEMGAIIVLSLIIIMVLGNFLSVPVHVLMWGSAISKGCTVYMVVIVMLFFWKISAYEKE